MKSDIDAVLLAELPPSAWPEAVRRQTVLRRHLAAMAEGRDETAATAQALGLSASSVWRLARALDQLERGGVAPTYRQGSTLRLERATAEVLAQVRAELVDLPIRAQVHEAEHRLAHAGLAVPSHRTLRLHMLGTPAADIGRALGRRIEAIVDACPLLLDLEQHEVVAHAVLSVVLRGKDGRLLAQHLSAGGPSTEAVAALTCSAAARLPRAAAICSTDAIQLPRGVPGLDPIAGLGLPPGEAITTAMGMKVGKTALRPRRQRPGGSAPPPVPIDLARRVFGQILGMPDVYAND